MAEKKAKGAGKVYRVGPSGFVPPGAVAGYAVPAGAEVTVGEGWDADAVAAAVEAGQLVDPEEPRAEAPKTSGRQLRATRDVVGPSGYVVARGTVFEPLEGDKDHWKVLEDAGQVAPVKKGDEEDAATQARPTGSPGAPQGAVEPPPPPEEAEEADEADKG